MTQLVPLGSRPLLPLGHRLSQCGIGWRRPFQQSQEPVAVPIRQRRSGLLGKFRWRVPISARPADADFAFANLFQDDGCFGKAGGAASPVPAHRRFSSLWQPSAVVLCVEFPDILS